MGLVVWIFVIVFLVLAIASLVGFGYFDSKFRDNAEKNLIRPFAAHQGSPVQKRDGSPQISCPIGTKISILGAAYEVYDPGLSCTSKPIGGQTNSVCGPMSTASGTELSGVGGSGECRIRDVSGQVGLKCNGKSICDLKVDQETLGAYPCNFSPDSPEYSQLPLDAESGETSYQGYWLHGVYTCVPE